MRLRLGRRARDRFDGLHGGAESSFDSERVVVFSFCFTVVIIRILRSRRFRRLQSIRLRTGTCE